MSATRHEDAEPAREFTLAERTVPHLLDSGARRWPERVALRDAERTLTYAQLVTTVDRRGSAQRLLGIGWQQPVLLMLDNHLDHILTWLGATYYGRVQAQVNTAYRGSLLVNVINDSGADTLVVEQRYCDRLAAIADEIPALRRLIVRGGAPALSGDRFEVLDFDTVLTDGPGDGAEQPVQPWDRYGIMYTSGTTGPSKGVVQPHALPFSYVSPAHWGLVDINDVVLVALPQFHIAGQWTGVLAPLMVGGSAAIVERFTASRFWDDVRRFGATQTTMMAAMAGFLIAQPERADDPDSTLRKVLLAPIVKEAEAFKKRFGVELTCGLGQTESSLPIVARYRTTSPGACGWLRSDFEARVVDDNDVDVEQGRPGELVIRPREPWSVMLEYNNAPDATVRKWHGLWLRTGDLVRQDETGQFFFVDRSADVIRRRGENISSVEVEAEILRHPQVRLAAVIGVASQDYEQEVKACVVLESGGTLDEAALHAVLRERLPYFMVPRYIELYDDLPRTPTERVKKSELRAEGVTQSSWDSRAHGLEARHSDR